MPTIDEILEQRFRMAEYRPGQREAIDALLSGQDLLCIQPTGHGKSPIYQVEQGQTFKLMLLVYSTRST